MLIDHVGAVLFPDTSWPRVIGRIAFPLFAWLLVNGWRHTSSRSRYILRLVVFALLSQIPYLLAFQPAVWRWNVFFSLVIGLAGLAWFESTSGWWRWLGLVFIAILAECFSFDHGVYGVVTIFCFNRYAVNFLQMAFAQIVLIGVRQVIVYSLSWYGMFSFHEWWVWAQPAALAALLFISCYNGQRGVGTKYLFYCFYPAHLLLLYCFR
jgi:hypothetical protein